MAVAKTIEDFERNPKLGFKVFKERLSERDAVFSEAKNKLLHIASKYTSKLRSPSGASSRISQLLTFKESNVVVVGRGKSDTHIGGSVGSAKRVAKARRYGSKNDDEHAGRLTIKDKKNGRLREISFRQNRAYDSFKFKLEYPYAELMRQSIFYYSTRRRMYRNKSKFRSTSPGSGLMGNKTRVYLPYIINNTWKRHPQSYVRGSYGSGLTRPIYRRTKTDKVDELGRAIYNVSPVSHPIKTASSFPRVDKHYINRIVRDFNTWAANTKGVKMRLWNIEATYKKDYDNK